MARPQTRRFGFVDFGAMGVLPSSEDADQFVCRRNNGDNVVVTRASIVDGVALTFPLLAPDGSATAPSYSFASDPDSGLFNVAANVLGVAIGGSLTWVISNASIAASGGTGADINVGPPSSTVPTLRPEGDDINTGVGRAGADQLSLIAGAIEGIRLTELNNGVIQAPDATLGITAFAGGGQTDAVALIASYNVLSTVATVADSVKLPPVFAVNSIIYVKNNGAEAADIFPATGDNLGEGLNTALSVPAGESKSFIATAANATWTQLLPTAGDVPDPLLLGDGTVANPSYSFASDPDTGVFRAGANELGLVANGVQIAQAKGVVGANQFIIAPGVFQNNAVAPSLAFSGGDLGFFALGLNQLAVSVQGAAHFLWEGNFFRAGSTRSAMLIDQTPTAILPTFSFQSNPSTGIGSAALDQLSLIAGGIEGIRVTEAAAVITVAITGDTTVTGSIAVDDAAGPILLNEAASATNPTIVPDRSMDDTGIGSIAGIDLLTLIGGGQRGMAVSKVGAFAAIGFYDRSPITKQTGVAVTTAAVHAACVALGLFSA